MTFPGLSTICSDIVTDMRPASKETMPMTTLVKPFINVDGNLSDWIASERIDYSDVPGYSLYAQAQGDYFDFALSAPVADRRQHHGLVQHRPECRHRLSDLRLCRRRRIQPQHQEPTAPPRSTPARRAQTLVLDNIQLAYSPIISRSSSPYPTAALGNPGAIDTLYDINDSAFRSRRLSPRSLTSSTPTTA